MLKLQEDGLAFTRVAGVVMRQVFSVIFAGLLASVLGAPAAKAWSLFPPQPTVGKPAPNFTATLFSGGKVTLDDYLGGGPGRERLGDLVRPVPT